MRTACSKPSAAARISSVSTIGATIHAASRPRLDRFSGTSPVLTTTICRRASAASHQPSATDTPITTICSRFAGSNRWLSASLADCSSFCIGSGVQVGDQLAFEPGDLVLQQQLALLEPPHLHLVDIQVELQA